MLANGRASFNYHAHTARKVGHTTFKPFPTPQPDPYDLNGERRWRLQGRNLGQKNANNPPHVPTYTQPQIYVPPRIPGRPASMAPTYLPPQEMPTRRLANHPLFREQSDWRTPATQGPQPAADVAPSPAPPPLKCSPSGTPWPPGGYPGDGAPQEQVTKPPGRDEIRSLLKELEEKNEKDQNAEDKILLERLSALHMMGELRKDYHDWSVRGEKAEKLVPQRAQLAAMKAARHRRREAKILERVRQEEKRRAREKKRLEEERKRLEEEKRRREEEKRRREEERRLREEEQRRREEERRRREEEEARQRILAELAARLARQERERREHEARERERRAREERERKAREEREREARAERERRARETQQRAEQARLAHEQVEAEKAKLAVTCATFYDQKWSALKTVVDVRYCQFPFPVFCDPTNAPPPIHITYGAVEEFLFSPLRAVSGTKDKKAILKEEILRWHPDKFNAGILPRICEADKDMVKEAAGLVARHLMAMKDQVR